MKTPKGHFEINSPLDGATVHNAVHRATELARGAEKIDAAWEFHHAVYSRVFLTPIHEKDTAQ